MAADIGQYGLFEVFDGGDQPQVDLVLIHGLNGHPGGSWRAAGSDIFWPKDLLPRYLKKEKVRILTYGYNAAVGDLLGRQSSDRVHHHAQTLVQGLFARRSLEDAVQRPILFLCHCLGGIIAKKALEYSSGVKHKNTEHLRSIYVSTFGLIFLGTPHNGADRDKWQHMLRSMTCAVHQNEQSEDVESQLIHALDTQSETLQNINIAFSNIMNRFRIFFFYEALKTQMDDVLDFIVDETSAAPTLGGTERAYIEASHLEMCRFVSSRSPGYELVVEAIKRYAQEAVVIVRKRWLEEQSLRQSQRWQEATELTDDLQSSLENRVVTGMSRGRDGETLFNLLPFAQNGGFVGREGAIGSIESKLSSRACNRRVALYGLGGIGKSQIALEYAYRRRDKSPQTSLFWIRASSRASFEQSYGDIAKTVGIPGIEDPKADVLGLVKAWLQSGSCGDWLMILDNADDEGLFFQDIRDYPEQTREGGPGKRTLFGYIPQSSKGSVLFTTRSKAAAVKLTGGGAAILVEPMSLSECETLLDVRLHGESMVLDEATQLFEELEFLPLAISQAAAFMRESFLSVSEYLQIYRSNDLEKTELLSHEFGDLARDAEIPNAVLSTWMISFNQIKSDHSRAADMISLMSIFDRQNIPKTLLQEEGESLGRFLRAVGTLKAFSLIAASPSNRSFDVHRLVHLSTRNWLTVRGEQGKWVKQAVELLSAVYPHAKHENRDVCTELFPHAEAVLSHDNTFRMNNAARSSLLDRLSGHLRAGGRYQAAQVKALEAVTLKEQELGPEHPNTLTSVSNLASVLQDQGKYEAAEEMNRRVLEGREKALGPEHLDTLTSVNNLASVLQYQGKYEAAEEMNRRVLEGREKVLGFEHPNTLTSVSNLASVLQYQGKYEAAEEMNRRALEGREKVLGPEHPDTLTSVSNLASVLQCQGKYEAAEEMNRRVLEGSEKVLGPEHPDTLTSVSNLASVLQDQGKYEAAEEMNRRALEGSEKVLGLKHPDTLVSVSNLAMVLQYQGKYEAAEEMNRQALEGREKVLGPEHPETLVSVNNLAMVLQDQGKYEAAEEMNRRVLEGREKVLGPEHPNTLTSVSNLASVLQCQGKYEAAEEMNRRVLEGREKVLGPEHPNTLVSVNNLALVLRHQGKYEAAEEMNRQALEGSEKVLGLEHPDALASVNNLASVLQY